MATRDDEVIHRHLTDHESKVRTTHPPATLRTMGIGKSSRPYHVGSATSIRPRARSRRGKWIDKHRDMLRRDVDFCKARSNNGTFGTHCICGHNRDRGREFVGALPAVRRVKRWGDVDGEVGANVLVLSDNLALKVDD